MLRIRSSCNVQFHLFFVLLGFIVSSVAGLTRRMASMVAKPSRKIGKVMFVKTHETGSSTLTGILHRFCDANGVACFVPPRFVWTPGQTLFPQPLSLLREELATGSIPSFDVLPSHSIFLPRLFEQIIPGSVKFSIFRDPKARTVASLSKNKTAAEIRQLLADLRADIPVDRDHPCGGESMLMSFQVPEKYMADLDFVLLTEKYDLGLVLLRRRLHWTTRDIIYLLMKVQARDDETIEAREELDAYLAGERDDLTPSAKAIIRDCIEPENKLYLEAKRRFKKQVTELSDKHVKSVNEELFEFKKIREAVQACCDKAPEDEYCATLTDKVERDRKKQAHHNMERRTDCEALLPDAV